VPQNAGLYIKSAATKRVARRCIVTSYCRASVSDASLFFCKRLIEDGLQFSFC
jgi:hypothetical protein